MYTAILGKNSDEISRFYFDKNLNVNNLKKSYIPNDDKINKEFMEKLDYSIGVYSPVENSNDFYIYHLNKALINNCSFKLNDIKGAYFSEVFLESKNDLFLDIMREVYDTGNSQELYGNYYENNLFYNKYIIKIFKIKELIYIICKNRIDYSLLSLEQEKLFNNDITAIAIIQNYHFIKCNRKYLELFELKDYDDVIGKEVGYTNLIENENVNIIRKNIDKIIKGKLSSFLSSIELKKNNDFFRYLNIDAHYIIYNGEPAVLTIYEDITEQELTRRERDKKIKETEILQKYMDFIQSVSNTGSGYLINGEFVRSKKLYEILEKEPCKDDSTKDITYDFVVDEDKPIISENYAKFSPEHDFVDFIIRIITAKGNLKYIHCYMKKKYLDDHEDYVSFYQDVTSEQLYLKELKEALHRSHNYQNQLQIVLTDKDQLLKDREMLLAEVHHRVKNNLQIVLSLINLNKEYESDPETILANTENRIYAMALLHEKIYGSDSLSEVNIKDYIESLVTSLFEIYSSNIEFHSSMNSQEFNMEQAIPIGLIVNELTLNTIKYAFPNNEKGNLCIEFNKEDTKYTLIVKDDGIGLPDGFNLDNLNSLGLVVVQNLTIQLGGTLSIIDCEGTGFKIEFNKE